MKEVAHTWPLVFDRPSFDRLEGAAGHSARPRVRYHWQSNRTLCGVSIPSQQLTRRFEPGHPRACPVCRSAVLGAAA